MAPLRLIGPGGAGEPVRLIGLPGVFHPRSDSWLLARSLAEEVDGAGAVLDLCTGSGLLAIVAAQRGVERVVAVDLSWRAVATARINGRLNGVHVDARQGDLFAPVAGERFDLIVSNPPYVPVAAVPAGRPRGAQLVGRLAAWPRRHRAARAWDAGADGRALLDRICALAPAHLRPHGVLLLTHSSICGVERTLELLGRGKLEATVLERRRGALGPLMRARVPALRARGLLADATDDEEIVVIAARRGA